MDLFRWFKRACGEDRPPAVPIPDLPHTPPVRRRYRFSGRVQGVGFRYESMMAAGRLGLTGWARNEDDGSVTVEIEGEAGYIDEFLRTIQAVPRFSITEIRTEELPLSGTETTFTPRYG